MAAVLQHGTFESQSLLAKHLPVEDHIVKGIIDDLGTLHNLHYSKLKYLNGKQMKPWPDTVDSSRDHYEPFIWLLNTILDLSRKNIKQSFHARLKFFLYSRNMQEGAAGDSPLKPDLLGCHCKSLGKDEKVSWRDVEIVVEINDHWPSIVSRATDYARCCFIFQEARKFVTAILFNHSMMEVRIGLYSPSGLAATEGFLLSSSEGFGKFVRAMIGLYARADAASAGINESLATNALIRIQNGNVYSITKVLGTPVYTIEKYKEGSKIAGMPHQQTPGHANSSGKGRYLLHSQGRSKNVTGSAPTLIDAADEELQRGGKFGVEDCDREIPRNDLEIAIYDSTIYRIENDIDWRDTVVPDTCILKQSWTLESHSDEGKSFKSLDGKFGLPRGVYSYEVEDGRSWSGHTSDIIPADATRWRVSATKASRQLEAIQPEVHIRKCIILDTEGISLLDADGPRQLVEGIVHAMIGHYVLFKHGWLHCDVSIDNVMLMKKETREAVKDFEETRGLTECIGFIGDGDVIEWRNNEQELTFHCSGTIPFVSMELNSAWSAGKQVVHTAMDDLESFIWVLLWAILVIMEERGELTDRDEKWFLAIMRADDTRIRILWILREQQESNRRTSLAPFRTLLIRFFEIADRASLTNRTYSSKEVWDSEELEGICTGFYEEYIKTGLAYLSQLASNWDDYDVVEDAS